MFSYHRLFGIFGRSIQDKTLQCDCDIHPWEIWVDEKQWAGKIRLVAFIDAFFLISYSAENSFERGIIIYKEKDAIENILREIEEKGSADQKRVAEDPDHRDFSFEHTGVYTVKSWGHEIGLKVEYPISSLKPYEIKINKPAHWAMRRRVKRGINRHTTAELMQDVVHYGLITQGQLMGDIVGRYMSGGVLDDTMKKYMDGVSGGSQAGTVALSNDNT